MHPAEMFRKTLSRLLGRDLRQIVRRLPSGERAEVDRLAALLGLSDLLAVILGEADEISG